MNKKVVIKAGGSGNIIETNNKPKIDWMSYRRMAINHEFIHDLCISIKKASEKGIKIGYVNGGVGAFLYINLARSLGLDDRILDHVGTNIVNTTSSIILEKLKDLETLVYPDLIEVDDFNESYFENYHVVVFKGDPSFVSSDSLAAYAATKVSESELLFFKKGVPVYHVGFDQPTTINQFDLYSLKQFSSNIETGAGVNSIIDDQAIKFIKNQNIKTVLYNSDDVNMLEEILLQDDPNIRKTTLNLEGNTYT